MHHWIFHEEIKNSLRRFTKLCLRKWVRMEPRPCDMNFRWIGGNDTSGLWLRDQARQRGLNAWVRNSTDQLHNIAVQGPKSRELLSRLFWTAPQQPTIEELGWFRFAAARLGDFKGTACVISRTGYTGELGYEVFCHPKDAETMFDRIWEAGQNSGLCRWALTRSTCFASRPA